MRAHKGAVVVRWVAAVLQVGVLGAAYRVQALTTEKMMVMRYFVAKNLLLEQHVFSPLARIAQAALLVVLAATAAAAAIRWGVRRERLVAVHCALAAALAAAGATMLTLMSAEHTRGLYVLVFGVWVALLVQIAVVLAVARRSARAAS